MFIQNWSWQNIYQLHSLNYFAAYRKNCATSKLSYLQQRLRNMETKQHEDYVRWRIWNMETMWHAQILCNMETMQHITKTMRHSITKTMRHIYWLYNIQQIATMDHGDYPTGSKKIDVGHKIPITQAQFRSHFVQWGHSSMAASATGKTDGRRKGFYIALLALINEVNLWWGNTLSYPEL